MDEKDFTTLQRLFGQNDHGKKEISAFWPFVSKLVYLSLWQHVVVGSFFLFLFIDILGNGIFG